jgi:hypothetical protein
MSTPITETSVKIFVRPRKLRRNGKTVNGWQCGFQRRGGVCSTSKQEAIEYTTASAVDLGFERVEVVEL